MNVDQYFNGLITKAILSEDPIDIKNIFIEIVIHDNPRLKTTKNLKNALDIFVNNDYDYKEIVNIICYLYRRNKLKIYYHFMLTFLPYIIRKIDLDYISHIEKTFGTYLLGIG